MAGTQPLLPQEPAADLLRTPVLAQQTLNPFPGSGVTPRLGPGLAAGQGQVLRLFGRVAAKTAFATDLAADRGLVTLQHDGNLALVVPYFQKRLDLVAFFLGELRVVSHRCLSCLSICKALSLTQLASLHQTVSCTYELNPRQKEAEKTEFGVSTRR